MDSDDEFFYHTFIDTSDESSDDDSNIMVAVAALIHNFKRECTAPICWVSRWASTHVGP